jgi:hypothetical protein
VAAECSKLGQLVSAFRDGTTEGASSSEICDVTKFVSQFRKILFHPETSQERIQTVVRTRNSSHITQAAKTSTGEECTLLSAKKNFLIPFILMTVIKQCVATIVKS